MTSFKVVSAADQALFEERLARAVRSLSDRDVVADVHFDTSTGPDGTVTYSALLQVQRAQARS